ncbi:BIG/ATPase V1 complex, subunit S1 [Mariannaea sp. PMI_226]|nr:BIG/ATPase V1 complex, subunit S1 [Mariannaea sp. PMI_226]
MRLQIVAGALALAGPSLAFSDSSSLVLLSASKLSNAPAADRFQTSAQAIDNAKSILSECPSDRYMIVSHPGVRSFDLVDAGTCASNSMRSLCRAAESSNLPGKYIISEVIGELSVDGLAYFIKNACAQKNKQVIVDELALPPVTSDRAASLEADHLLTKNIDDIATSDSYTLLYMTTSGEPAYEPEFVDPVRMDLKRDLRSHMVREDKNRTIDNRPLFEKYQFFTPGIFMAIITAIILFSILGVGLRALASLEVSYGAFDKEMGPAAQKKQQ